MTHVVRFVRWSISNRTMQGVLFFGTVVLRLYNEWVLAAHDPTLRDVIITGIMLAVLAVVVVPFARDAIRTERELQKVRAEYARTIRECQATTRAAREALPQLTARWFGSGD